MAIQENLQKIIKELSKYNEKLTVSDVAKIMNCGKEAIRERIDSGQIKNVRIGRTTYISKEWLILYLQNGGGLRRDFFDKKCEKLVQFCSEPRTREEIRLYMGYSTKAYTTLILRKLVKADLIKQTERPHSIFQKYVSVSSTD